MVETVFEHPTGAWFGKQRVMRTRSFLVDGMAPFTQVLWGFQRDFAPFSGVWGAPGLAQQTLISGDFLCKTDLCTKIRLDP